MLQNIVSMKDTIILVLILPRYEVLPEKDAQNVELDGLPLIYGQYVVTEVKLFIMTMKSLLEVQNTNNSEFGCY